MYTVYTCPTNTKPILADCDKKIKRIVSINFENNLCISFQF